MAGNDQLNRAKRSKNDEFYTQLRDIEEELQHYAHHFKGKVVYCNCDDPRESNFFKYFAANFNALGLKRLITTSYAGSPICGTQLSFDDMAGLKDTEPKQSHCLDIRHVEDFNDDGAVDLSDVDYLLRHDANASTPLEGGGDFRSAECIDLLKQADIVVTNPPFSLFREYLAQLMEQGKRFLILANPNAVVLKKVFPHIQQGRMWLGCVPMGTTLLFDVPPERAHELCSSGTEGSKYRIVDGVIKARVHCVWLTNLMHSKRHEDLVLYRRYSPEDYPNYDNYDAIEVSKVAEIPVDYQSKMGVPISFLSRHNPEQFEIVGSNMDLINSHFTLNGESLYSRLVIRPTVEESPNHNPKEVYYYHA